ncbi:hypothetical protein PV05_10223 [Exophiala xenobiotica]|uniref:MICOS complex subunit MIC12 n=1 Tax=Exophiala xenobiotica TaxID=348802 RepID=A0A0D2EA66_9EURO|nr:uncharacterized protein PV05_10223 [Exophiala xenobiotica]KIW51510.1 hypothetical protein PV05_10223 [Exophiala xenobiotica]
MGFTTGFLGGLTLTYSLLYMSLYVHRANRNVQKTLLKQQANLLNSVVEPPPPLPEPPAYEVRKAGLVEELKDHWNSEIEKLVRNVQTTDWAAKREQWESTIAATWNKVRSSQPAQELEQKARVTAEELESSVKNIVAEGKDKARTAAKDIERNVKDAVTAGKDKARTTANEVKEKVVQGSEKASEKAQNATREPRLLELK